MIRNHYKTVDTNHHRRVNRYNRYFEGRDERIKAYPTHILPDVVTNSMDMLVPELYLNGPSPLARQCLRRAQQASTSHFLAILHEGETVEVELDDQRIPVVGKNIRFRTNANYWFKAMALAIIQRNRTAIDVLCQITDEIYKTDELGSDDFDNALAGVYKVIFAGGNLAEQLVKAAALFVPDDFDQDRFIFVSNILWPQVAILRTIFTAGAEAEYNQKMEEALLLNQKYWVETNDTYWEGAFPIPLIALVVLAHDHAGYKLTVENGYIPEWVIEGK